ncbi:hypothetical protein ACGYLO_16380 [Sulfitobacter sp. 1A13353]|uniref:hypothetical protein n=1 Tax=Sulfitobacter sp. 1A13353 TaxID=3368568 RepID=UPI003744CBB8
MTEKVEHVADALAEHCHEPRGILLMMARAAITAMQKDAAMDRLVAEGQRCDAMTPQEAAKVLLDAYPLQVGNYKKDTVFNTRMIHEALKRLAQEDSHE